MNDLKEDIEERKQTVSVEEKKYPTINAVFKNNISNNGAGVTQTTATAINKNVTLPKLNNIMSSNFSSDSKQKEVDQPQVEIKQEVSSPRKYKQPSNSVGEKSSYKNVIPSKKLPIPLNHNLESLVASIAKPKDICPEPINNLFKDSNKRPEMSQPNTLGYSKKQATILNQIKEERLSQINSKQILISLEFVLIIYI